VQLHQGDFSGRGEISFQTTTGLLVLDLANVSDLSSFESCAAQVAPSSNSVSGDAFAPDGGSCFTLIITGGTFTSNEGEIRYLGDATIRPCGSTRGDCLKSSPIDGQS
jgi:hypothetical protein